MEQSTINQRIKKLVEELDGGNKLAFSKRVGMSNQGLGEIIGDRQSNPSYPNLVKMLQKLPQVRMEWLMLGEGPMLKSEFPPEPTPKKTSVKSGARSTSSNEFAKDFPFAIVAPLNQVPSARDEKARRLTQLLTKRAAKVEEQNSARLPGTELIEQVAQNTIDIQKLFTLIEEMKAK